MNEFARIIRIIFVSIGAYIGMFLGNIDGLIITLLVVAICDYITGVAVAIVQKKLSSDIGFKGIARKVLMFAVVGIANLIDVHILKQGSVIRTATIFFYLSNEGISLLENGSNLGLPIPHKLKNVLLQLKSKDDNENDNKDTEEKEK